MFVLVILTYALLTFYETIPLYKKKQYRDFWVNTIIGIFSFTIAMLLSFNVKIPSPVKPIKELVISIFGK